jgi:hypothetical protein
MMASKYNSAIKEGVRVHRPKIYLMALYADILGRSTSSGSQP